MAGWYATIAFDLIVEAKTFRLIGTPFRSFDIAAVFGKLLKHLTKT